MNSNKDIPHTQRKNVSIISYNHIFNIMSLWLKICIILFVILLIFNKTIAQNNSDIAKQDSLFADSISIQNGLIDTTKKTSILNILNLNEIEQRVIDREDNFLDFNSILLNNKNIIRTNGNLIYTLQFWPQNFYLYNVKLNNIFFTNQELYNYIYYYKVCQKNNEYFFLPVEYISVSPLSSVQYGLGDDNLQRYFINLQKKRLFNYSVNVSFFAHSAKQKYQEHKNNFEDFALQVEKEYESISIDYNFIKHFKNGYTQDLFNYFDEDVKLTGFTHLLHLQMMDNFLQFSYLNQQFTRDIPDIENKLYHHQFACSFFTEIRDISTEVNARYFIDKYRGSHIIENYKDWQIDMRNTFSLYRDYGKVEVYNNYFYFNRLNEKFLDTKMKLNLPISSYWNNSISAGFFHYQPVWNVIVKDRQSALSTIKEIRISSGLNSENKQTLHSNKIPLSFSIQPFYRIYEKNYQIDSLIKYTPYYQQIDFEEKGIYTEFDTDMSFLKLQHNLHFEFTFTKIDTEIYYYPEKQIKLFYQIKKDLMHNNFIALRFRIGFLSNFLNYEGNNDRHLFFDINPVININRFRIYVHLQNILKEKYSINPSGKDKFIVEFHWNFLN